MFVGVILLRKTAEVGSAYMDAAELRFENGEDALEQGLINFIGPGVPLSGPPPGCMPWQQVASVHSQMLEIVGQCWDPNAFFINWPK